MEESGNERVFDGVEGVEEAVGEPFFADFVPEMLYGIAFRAVRRKPDEADVLRYCESFSDVPSRPIHDQEDVFAVVSSADLGQEITHERCSDLGKNQRDHSAVVGRDGSINEGVFANQLAWNHRTATFGSPTATGNGDSPETRLILKHQAQRASRLRKSLGYMPDNLREFFLNRLWAFGSTSGCLGHGVTFRHP